MTPNRIVSVLLEVDGVDPKDFVQAGNFDVPRVAQIRFSDMAVVHDPEDPLVHWAFLIWELERVGREPRRGIPQLGLSNEEWAYVNEKRDIFVEPSRDANARGSAYITKYGLTPEAWMRINTQLCDFYDSARKGIHVVEVSQNVPQFTQMPESVEAVSKLLEDEEFSLDDIKDYVAGQKVNLADGIEFHIGFAIGTSDEYMIEANAHERGVEPDWDAINNAILLIEKNAVEALEKAGVQCRSEGHDDNSLLGSAWVTGGTPGFEFVRQQIEMGEPYRTSSGTLPNEIATMLYTGVQEDIAGLIDVDIEFFDVGKIERAENGEELEESDEQEDPKEFVNYHFKFEEVIERTIHELAPGVVILGIRNATGTSHKMQYDVLLDAQKSEPRLWHEPIVKLIKALEAKLTANYGWKMRPYRVPNRNPRAPQGIDPISISYSGARENNFTLHVYINIMKLDYLHSQRFLVDPEWETPF